MSIDATFLTRSQREPSRHLAAHLSVPLRIFFSHADIAVLKQPIEARQREGREIPEAGPSVLQHQLDVYPGLDVDEQGDAILIGTQLPCGSVKTLALITQSRM